MYRSTALALRGELFLFPFFIVVYFQRVGKSNSPERLCRDRHLNEVAIASEKAPPGTAAVVVIRPRQGGAGFKYTIPMTALAKLGPMNKELDPRGRYDAVMAAEGLFQVEPIQ